MCTLGLVPTVIVLRRYFTAPVSHPTFRSPRDMSCNKSEKVLQEHRRILELITYGSLRRMNLTPFDGDIKMY